MIDLTDIDDDAESIDDDEQVRKLEKEPRFGQRESAVSRDRPLEPRSVELESAEAQQQQPDASSLVSGYLSSGVTRKGKSSGGGMYRVFF